MFSYLSFAIARPRTADPLQRCYGAL